MAYEAINLSKLNISIKIWKNYGLFNAANAFSGFNNIREIIHEELNRPNLL